MVSAYAPSSWFTPTELTAVTPPPASIPTKATLAPIAGGLAVSTIPTLPFWPGSTTLSTAIGTNTPAAQGGAPTAPIPTQQV
jgi:hypothetical protein